MAGDQPAFDEPVVGRKGFVDKYRSRGKIIEHSAGGFIFGALPLSLSIHPEIDALVFTANKCLEGIAGLAFALARVDRLGECAGHAGSWCLDLADLHAHLLRYGTGVSRFTPPPQIVAAFSVALDLYDREGGQTARLARYQQNMAALYDGLLAFGLAPCLPRPSQGPIVVNVHAPEHPAWNLRRFVELLREGGVLISDFYYTKEPTFRVGCIGAFGPSSMKWSVDLMASALTRMGITPSGSASPGYVTPGNVVSS